MYLYSFRKDDIEDLLTDQLYFQAVFHSLPRVKAMVQAQSELGMANETIASEFSLLFFLS
jgi:ESCRT-I complex subunit VPS37